MCAYIYIYIYIVYVLLYYIIYRGWRTTGGWTLAGLLRGSSRFGGDVRGKTVLVVLCYRICSCVSGISFFGPPCLTPPPPPSQGSGSLDRVIHELITCIPEGLTQADP